MVKVGFGDGDKEMLKEGRQHSSPNILLLHSGFIPSEVPSSSLTHRLNIKPTSEVMQQVIHVQPDGFSLFHTEILVC